MSEEHKPPFMIQYQHKGAIWVFDLYAESWEDAEQRLKSIGNWGRVVGSDVQTISVNPVTLPFAALYVRLICWWRNWRARR